MRFPSSQAYSSFLLHRGRGDFQTHALGVVAGVTDVMAMQDGSEGSGMAPAKCPPLLRSFPGSPTPQLLLPSRYSELQSLATPSFRNKAGK